MKVYILYRDYGYGEMSIYGATRKRAVADAWEGQGYENEAVEADMSDRLPEEHIV